MKKALKIAGWALLAIILLALLTVLGIRFVFRQQAIEYLNDKQHEQYVGLLRTASPYAADTAAFRFAYIPDTARSREIRNYFRLDTLLDNTADTWTNTVSLATFVAGNIPHANQTVQPERRNAIALWEYHLYTEPAFNCRLHAIMLHELLLASGITNRFVTCLPADPEDRDCHVVNTVWLPEIQKWAMIDSDGCSFVTDPEGTPLSLGEMRDRTVKGLPMEVHHLERGTPYDNYLTYWAKNLYWFICWEETGYDKEPADEGYDIALVPPDMTPFKISATTIVTTDDARFWAAPEE